MNSNRGKWMLETLERLGVIDDDLPTVISHPNSTIISSVPLEPEPVSDESIVKIYPDAAEKY